VRDGEKVVAQQDPSPAREARPGLRAPQERSLEENLEGARIPSVSTNRIEGTDPELREERDPVDAVRLAARESRPREAEPIAGEEGQLEIARGKARARGLLGEGCSRGGEQTGGEYADDMGSRAQMSPLADDRIVRAPLDP
jgi:hypothetical protein